jgi:hypothetical protein
MQRAGGGEDRWWGGEVSRAAPSYARGAFRTRTHANAGRANESTHTRVPVREGQ